MSLSLAIPPGRDDLASTAVASPTSGAWLWSPWADFLLLGGGSLLAFPILLLAPADRVAAPLAATMWALINLINHPHFASSYQIFYRGFRAKAFGPTLPRGLRLRYLFAGVIAPLTLAVGLGLALASGQARLLGYAGNLMALLVGWHYVKQGFGMLMLDAALKRHRFTPRTRQVLVANSYAVWLFSWASGNQWVKATHLWGLQYFAFDLPAWLVAAAGLAAGLTTALAAGALVQSWRAERRLPWNGLAAYCASLYAWQAFVRFNPLWLLVFPALHSLQYLAVVWRYQSNLERARPEDLAKIGAPGRRLAMFGLSSLLLGFVLFWGGPLLLGAAIPVDMGRFGPTPFLFVFWVFVNIHHFFLDNVMWRRENPDMRRHLFG